MNQIRVSNDYASDAYTQWRIGRNSMMAWAVGLRPFKDVFRTTLRQLPNIYLSDEPNPELQSAVATLSTGPVAIGDKIGATNVSIVMRTCTTNGTILAPSRPATAIESTYLGGAAAPAGEVWATEATVTSGASTLPPFGLVLVADLQQAYTLQPRHLRWWPWAAPNTRYFSYPWSTNISSSPLAPFSTNESLVLPACPAKNNSHVFPWQLHLLVPTLSNGWLLKGEVGKYVPFSPRRFLNVDAGSAAQLGMTVAGMGCGRLAIVKDDRGEMGVCDLLFLFFTWTGAAGEKVAVAVVPPGSSTALTVTCAIGSSGTAQVTVQKTGSYSCD